MCRQCNYSDLLVRSNVTVTRHRLRVLEIIGDSPSPLSHQEIFHILRKAHSIDRVTVYRVLDLLVEKGVIERISSGDRCFRYGLAPGPNHPAHSHFFCHECGRMECLDPRALKIDLGMLEDSYPAMIQRVEVRLDGICRDCLKRREGTAGTALR